MSRNEKKLPYSTFFDLIGGIMVGVIVLVLLAVFVGLFYIIILGFPNDDTPFRLLSRGFSLCCFALIVYVISGFLRGDISGVW